MLSEMLSEIVDDEYKKQIMFLLNNNWTGRTDCYFPVQTSVNIELVHYTKLNNYNYMYVKKNTTDTTRAILFTFLNTDAENTSVIILKDFTIYNIDIKCSYEYFYGSIFDISYTENEITIYDSFMTAGNKINNFTYVDRISEATYFINNLIQTSVPINVINYYPSISVFSELNDNEEIFMIPNNLPITTGVNYSCFKWKPPEKLLFSLLIKEHDDDIILYTTNFKKLARFAIIKNDTTEGKDQIQRIKQLDGYVCGCVTDFNITDHEIIAIKVNTTRTIPPTIRSIEKILHIKRENITFEDLLKN